MGRIANCFADCRDMRRKALIPYINAAEPTADISLKLMHALVVAGADMLAVGIPLSKLNLVGPLQPGHAIDNNELEIDLNAVLQIIVDFRQKDSLTPIVVLVNIVIIESIGYAAFAEMAQRAGINGVMVLDLSAEKSIELGQCLRAHHIETVFAMTQNTSAEQIQLIAQSARGYLYYHPAMGIEDKSSVVQKNVQRQLELIHKEVDTPIAFDLGVDLQQNINDLLPSLDAIVISYPLTDIVNTNSENEADLLKKASEMMHEIRHKIDLPFFCGRIK